MTSLVIGIILIVGGIAFAAAPFFRRGEPRDSGPTHPARNPHDDDPQPQHSGVHPGADDGMRGTDQPPIPSSLLAELEELELDRAMGKLGDEDYRLLRASWDRRAAADRTIAAASIVAPLDSPGRAVDTSHSAADVTAMGAGANDVAGASHEPSKVDAVASSPDLAAEAERLIREARGTEARCRSCGPRPEPAAKYCSQCGTPLGSCPSCGAVVRQDDARFCDRCGGALSAT